MIGARWRFLLALALFATWARPAGATSSNRVVLLATENEQDLTALELLARVRGELHAAELEVILQSVPADADLRITVESSAPELSPAAVIGVRYLRPVPPQAAGAEVWISDRLASTTLMQVVRLGAEQGDPAARLAVQVAEVLKARLALLWVKPEPPKPPPRVAPASGADSRYRKCMVGFSWAWAWNMLTTRAGTCRAGCRRCRRVTSLTETAGRRPRSE